MDEDEAKGRVSPAPSSEVSTVLTQGKMQSSPRCVPWPGHRGLQESLPLVYFDFLSPRNCAISHVAGNRPQTLVFVVFFVSTF